MGIGKFVARSAALCALLLSFVAQAADTPATDYNKRLKIWQTISPGGDAPFGERINLYTGELTFLQTDLRFPGIGPDIAVSRMTVSSLEDVSLDPLPFGNWDLALPRMQVLVARRTGWKTLDGSTTTTARCTKFNLPWSDGATGITLVTDDGESQPLLRRVAENARQPTMANDVGKPMVFPAVTNANWQIGCLSSTTNGQPGEGFLAVSPEGVRYWLTHLVTSPVEMTFERDNGATIRTFRDLAKMHVSRIEDRFGNTLQFTWDGSKLTRIQGSDGRRVDFAWRTDAAVIGAVTMQATDAAPRTWRYEYALSTVPAQPIGTRTIARLTGVVLPDGARWQYGGIVGTVYDAATDARLAECTTRSASPLSTGTPATGTVISPSGLVGTFEIRKTWRGRSYVQSKCAAHMGAGEAYEGVPPIFGARALIRRTISGAGVAAQTWTYAYSPAQGSTVEDACAAAGTCPETAWVDVTDPKGDRTRHWYATRWGVGEGRSIKIETFQGASTLLKTETLAYAAPTGNAWPPRIGRSLNSAETNVAKQESWAPLSRRTITQQGVTFTWTADGFDAFARPIAETGANSLGASKTDGTWYHDLPSKWILGQVARTTTNGVESGSTSFDANAMPLQVRAFGKLRHTLAYHADGTVASVSDGRDGANIDTTVHFSAWKRGIPQKITFPDRHAKSAVVDDFGQIRSVTDEIGAKTCYEFDAMGRMSKIIHPSERALGVCDGGAGAAWLPTVIAFSAGNPAAYGVPAGHWRQASETGNRRRVVVFDALWRPVAEQNADLGDVAGTMQEVIRRYDHAGRVVFESYPINTIGQARFDDASLKGTRTRHDALGRVVRVEQDSEHGVLATTTSWLPAFQQRVTSPRGHATTTSFQVFDRPSTDFPSGIAHPEGAFTDIRRDVFGKPTSITRRNLDRSISLSRVYSYDSAQALCRTYEPETGSTLLGHDAAGNLAWSAAGLAWGSGCDAGTSAAVLARKSTRTYDNRNRLVELEFADYIGEQTWTWTADSLPATITTYNGAGRTIPVINAYSYNHRRLLGGQGESLQQPGWYTWAMGFGYDHYGTLARHVHPDGLIVEYAPNALGQATRAGHFATGASYHPNGALRQFTYGNGLVHTLAQNVRGMPDRSRDAHGSNVVLDDGYDYDANGNVVAISDALPGNTGNRTMAYDGLDRLTAVSSPMFTAARYEYDVLDNLQRATIGGAHGRDQVYCYHAGTRRLEFLRAAAGGCAGSAAQSYFEYDTQGNLQKQNQIGYVFSQDNRLREVTGVEYYRYDGHGRRLLAWRPGLTNILSMYGEDGVLRYVADRRKGIVHTHVYLGGSLVATREKVIATGAETTKYQHTDALGTPVAVTDANRNVVERSRYEPYGKVLNRPDRDGPGYTGHVEDAATGLVYMQQRYYDAEVGRFLSVDPIAAYVEAGENFNRYWYANDNPYRFTDPDGRQSRDFEAISREAGVSPASAPARSADDWLGPAIGVALTAVLAAPVVAEAAMTALANPRVVAAATEVAADLAGFGASATTAAKITGYTKHGLNQAISRDGGRGVSPKAILSATKTPTKVAEQAGGKTMYVGKDAKVVLNSEGKVVTTIPRNSAALRDRKVEK